MTEKLRKSVLDWLDERIAWQFVAILYVGRWVALAPVLVLIHFVLPQDEISAASMPEEWSQGTAPGLFFGLVILSPLFETLLECTLPYWIVSRVRDYRTKRPKRCWGFVAISACVMAVLHLIPAALLPAFITGAFLAYCYAHFAAVSTWKAVLATAAFHGAINIVGWTMLVFS